MEGRAFRAMGTEIELFVDAPGGATAQLAAAEAEFHRLEAILSRFRPDSELSQLNRDGLIDAGPDLLRITELALAGREETGGRFDPTVHDAVVAAGYDRTFPELPSDGAAAHSAPCGGEVRIEGSAIALGTGVRLDFGGIGKGYATECAAQILATAGPCLVNAGGDLAVCGGAWPVGVQTTGDGHLTLELSRGALATSGRDRRHWTRAGRKLHHLVDPTTGTSAGGDLLRVSVVAADAVAAEIWAKALFLAGDTAAAAEAESLGMPAVLVTLEGRTHLVGGLA